MLANENHEWSETRLRVRYAETDQAGIVYHSNYLVWMEVGRVELCRDHGFNYRDMEREEDSYLPVVEVNVKYRFPAKYDDEIVIRTRIVRLRTRTVRFAYEVVRASDGRLLAVGETHHVVMNKEGRTKSFPPKYAEMMKRMSRGEE
jgi:acyl-CoA thioester hydrolase